MGQRIRALTDSEATLARQAFGDAIRLETVRLIGWPFARAFVAGRWFRRDWIVWPSRALVDDFTTAALGAQAVLVHELTHVWQSQRGVNLLFAKLKAGDSPASYAYAADETCLWQELNIEQQAMVMEHRFLAQRGLHTPASRGFYDALCPFADPDQSIKT